MCGGAVGDFFDDATESLSNIDPTTTEGLINVAGGGLAGGLTGAPSDLYDDLSGKTAEEEAEKAAAEAEAAQQEIAQVYADQFAQFQEMTAPYREAGESFLPEFQDLLTEGGRAGFMQRALDSQEFQNIAGAATDQLISNSAALGNRLSSGIQKDIGSTTGQLATDYALGSYNDRLNQLGQGVNLGLGTLGTSLGALQSSTAGQTSAMNNIANINFQASQAAANQPNLLGGLLGAGAGALFSGGNPYAASLGYNIGTQV